MSLNGSTVVRADSGEKNSTFWRGEHTEYRPADAGMREPEALYRHILKGFVPNEPFIDETTTIVAFGSCFAQHISKHLNTIGFNVASREGKAYISSMGDGIVNTFAIRQQFEWAWEGRVPEVSLWHGYKAEEFGYDEQVRIATKDLFDRASVFIITLGLSEIWYDEPTGEVFWRAVPAAQFDPQRHKFRMATHAENKANLHAIHDLIRKHRPDANIVFTVSPVPIIASFRPIGCIPASAVTKAVLRSAIDEVINECAEDQLLHYFPSYEIVREYFHYPFQEDFRHPVSYLLQLNMLTFERYFCKTGKTDADVQAAYISAIDLDDQRGAMSHAERTGLRRKIQAAKQGRSAHEKPFDAPSIERERAAGRRDAKMAERNAQIAARAERVRLREERRARIAARAERIRLREERRARMAAREERIKAPEEQGALQPVTTG